MTNDLTFQNLSVILYQEIHQLIKDTKRHVAQTVNQVLVELYWKIGNRIAREVLKDQRADYGKEVVSELAKQLSQEFGSGFSRANLFHMIRFAEAYPEEQIVYALSRQLGWTHFRQLIYIEDPLKRKFYTEMCRLEYWSTRTLDKKIQSMLFERTAISHKPEEIIRQELEELSQTDQLTPNLIFKDPYVLDFLELPQQFSESDLENAILSELCSFIQEFGTDFCFVARQKRITIDCDDYFLDLLFYHRALQRLIAIELKLGKFTAAHKGQMELYLRWLERNERRSGEGKPLGLILCSEKKQGHVELLELDRSGIHVAQYLTQLPPRKLLESKLGNAIKLAKEKISRQKQFENNSDENESVRIKTT